MLSRPAAFQTRAGFITESVGPRLNVRAMRALPKAVVVVSPDFPPASGGIQRMTERIARLAFEDGVRVAVVAPKAGAYAAYDATLPFMVFRYEAGSQTQTILSMARMTRHAVRMIRAERIVAMLWKPPGLAAALLRLSGLRVPVTVVTHGTDVAKQVGVIRQCAFRATLWGTDVVTNSRYTARLLAERGVRAVRIVNPGAGPAERRNVQRAAAPTVLSVGRLVPRKGVDRLIDAIGRLVGRYPNLRLIIVGEGPDGARLERLAISSGIAAHVEFLGRVDDAELGRRYAEAWCFAMPNRNEGRDVEGFGIVFLEAALHGLPTIGGRGSGADDAIADGETGFLVNGNDVSEVTDALERLLSDPDAAERLGEAGRERALRDFSWQRYMRELLAG